MDCPICLANKAVSRHDRVPDMEHGSGLTANFRACRVCGVLFQDPFPSGGALRAMYGPNYRAQQRGGIYGFLKLIQGRLSAQRFQKYISERNSRILELGCGGGYLLTALRQAGFVNLSGVDWAISRELVQAEPAITFIAHDITAFAPAEPVDVILINNVLEHILDPRALIAHCRSYLRQGGRIILVTPNAESASYGLFGRFWAGLHSPWHIFIFTARSLTVLATSAQFEIRTIASGEDPGGWGISVQNLWRNSWPRSHWASGYGTIAMLATILCSPLAVMAQVFGSGSTLLAVIEADRGLPLS